MKQKSYAHGLSAYQLLGETIGKTCATHAILIPATMRLFVYSKITGLPTASFEQVTTVAKALFAMNIREKGDRVGLWSPQPL